MDLPIQSAPVEEFKMVEWLLENYLWLKAVHVIALISWMAGLLYLPRLYVYHVENAGEPACVAMLAVMERRLLRYIMNPAMVVTTLLGGLMIWANPGVMEGGWMHAKLTLLVGLFGVHGILSKYRRELAAGTCEKSARFFRILNEVPTVLMIGIVILVIAQPI